MIKGVFLALYLSENMAIGTVAIFRISTAIVEL